ncbi:unnamed protein product [Ambrosiozyma monospora]|uniref:Unnamed protein product n=1 Tax=Ambrosiozyma monospora TaxID=43982 RepID=A0ACB5SRY0_AMBMO|nr:unnamed protein product [Ambrosiozyma monospora]
MKITVDQSTGNITTENTIAFTENVPKILTLRNKVTKMAGANPTTWIRYKRMIFEKSLNNDLRSKQNEERDRRIGKYDTVDITHDEFQLHEKAFKVINNFSILPRSKQSPPEQIQHDAMNLQFKRLVTNAQLLQRLSSPVYPPHRGRPTSTVDQFTPRTQLKPKSILVNQRVSTGSGNGIHQRNSNKVSLTNNKRAVKPKRSVKFQTEVNDENDPPVTKRDRKLHSPPPPPPPPPPSEALEPITAVLENSSPDHEVEEQKQEDISHSEEISEFYRSLSEEFKVKSEPMTEVASSSPRSPSPPPPPPPPPPVELSDSDDDMIIDEDDYESDGSETNLLPPDDDDDDDD